MRSVRLRLFLLALLPIVVLLPILLGATMLRWIERFDDLLIAKVASDLRVAEQYFRRIEATQAATLTALAQSVDFDTERAAGDAALNAFLAQSEARLGLDFILYGALNSETIPEAALEVATAATPDAPSAGLALFDATELTQISPDLANRAALSIVPTEAARPIARDVESRGMLILAAHRFPGSDQVLIGGQLLNRNLSVIDTMNSLIYQEEGTTSAVRTGTTTLFLDDVRISTNVRLFEGERALGTRVSEVVWQQVMVEGDPWLDRAFVVNDWYISGYVPLTNIAGERIGMLYTGFLAAPFTAQRNQTILSLVLAFLVAVGVAVPFFLRLARGIFAPLEQMTGTMARAEAGELNARIGEVGTQDEIGTVARHLDKLLDQVQERDEALRSYAENLNELVDQRTEELQDTNRKLEATFAQLVMSEKLATVGEITAGVAHEINNPVAVIQGNLEVMRLGLGDTAEDYRTEFDLIDAQTHRINVIVGKLLNFTRPEDLSGSATLVDPLVAVQDALLLVAPDLRHHGIEVECLHHGAPQIRIVETELQQVLVNLFLNAAQAMEHGGTLSIETRAADWGDQAGAEIAVSDTGPGLPDGTSDAVFDPFYTTKPGKGSGLGLSISQNLMARVGGHIRVESEFGQGATFFIWCPVADNSSDNAE
ncbi:cache domain-containing protein [Gymnodinialimonas sp. 2305UL16-5]|uniref:sensor histidine kinase n=1 Tax=Gymnodinialimonas mytili TaxID=3126503 RepID=UPI00309506A1